MDEKTAISKMIAPGTKRPGKYMSGVIQVWLTRACNLACTNCTQGSNLGGNPGMMTVAQFEGAVRSLKGYFGVVGVFGGNPALHPKFDQICRVMRTHVPFEQRGLWCNHPMGWGKEMRATFNPAVSNLNVHMDRQAYEEFRRDWPEANVFGLDKDSRHSPCYVAMKDVLKKECPTCNGGSDEYYNTSGSTRDAPCPTCHGDGEVYDESRAWELISGCDINQHWSAMIGVFRGDLRAWFCEIAGAQSMLHQHEPDYPDTGIMLVDPITADVNNWWWRQPMTTFVGQVRKHCHDCGVPLRGYGSLACDENGVEQVSATHQGVYRPKRSGRRVELVTVESQLQPGRLTKTTQYLQNSSK